MTPSIRSARPCPACTAPLTRIPRLRADRLLRDEATGRSMRRYVCRHEGCGWQGLLPRRSRRAALATAWAGWSVSQVLARRPRLLPATVGWPLATVALASAVLAVLAGVEAVHRSAVALSTSAPASHAARPAPALRADAQRLPALPAGESHDGESLPPRHPWLRPVSLNLPGVGRAASAAANGRAAAVPPLTLRRNCAWGQPGRNPYRGSVEQALVHARLPADVVAEVTDRASRRQTSDRVEIRREGIRGVTGGREFETEGLAMAFGETLCLGTRVNFAPGHVEQADLYEVQDSAGRRHAVMVPDVCGNVTVLAERGEKRRWQVLAAADPGEPLHVLQAAMWSDAPATVAEPGSLGIGLLGLAGLAWASRGAMRQRRLIKAGTGRPE